MNEDRSLSAEQEVGRINAFFPILPNLGNHWAAERPWEDATIALNLHLTTLTACLVRELSLGGGTFVLSAANPRTTDAVHSGRSVNDSSPRSKVYISLRTMSVESPTERANSSVVSSSGVRISSKP